MKGSAESIDPTVKSLVDRIAASVISNRNQKETEDSEATKGFGLKITNLKTCDWSDDDTRGNKSSKRCSPDIILSSDDQADIVQEPTDYEDDSNDAKKDCDKVSNGTHESYEDDSNDAVRSNEEESPRPKKLEKRLQCQHCKKRFALVKWYQVHKCKKIKCSKCDFENVSRLEMKEHKETNHKKTKPNKEQDGEEKKAPVTTNKEKIRVDKIPGKFKLRLLVYCK